MMLLFKEEEPIEEIGTPMDESEFDDDERFYEEDEDYEREWCD